MTPQTCDMPGCRVFTRPTVGYSRQKESRLISPLRICVATTVFPQRLGDGEGTFIWQFVKVLRGQGAEVTVVAMHSAGLPAAEEWDGVRIVRPRYWWPVGAESLRKDGGGLPINFRRYPLARVQLPALMAA